MRPVNTRVPKVSTRIQHALRLTHMPTTRRISTSAVRVKMTITKAPTASTHSIPAPAVQHLVLTTLGFSVRGLRVLTTGRRCVHSHIHLPSTPRPWTCAAAAETTTPSLILASTHGQPFRSVRKPAGGKMSPVYHRRARISRSWMIIRVAPPPVRATPRVLTTGTWRSSVARRATVLVETAFARQDLAHGLVAAVVSMGPGGVSKIPTASTAMRCATYPGST